MRGQVRGFTLVELVLVIVVVGVLSAVAAMRYFDRTVTDVLSFVDASRSLIRYGQKIAIAQNRPVYVRLDGNSVALCFTSVCGGTNLVPAAGGTNSGTSATVSRCGVSSWACEGVPSGVAYTTNLPAGASTFYFDGQGKPFAAADASTSAVSSFQPLTITVTGDGSSHPIYVEQETGYVWN